MSRLLDEEYVKMLEQSNEMLQHKADYYALLMGACYKTYIVDERIDVLDFTKIMEYYVSYGWVLHAKKKVSESRRRWEIFSLPTGIKSKIEPHYGKVSHFQFPYKPHGRSLLEKYGMQSVEALNRFNIMLDAQSYIEDKLPIEIFHHWCINFIDKN